MSINIDFGEVLTKAWKIVWKFKVLWIFGILAGFGSSSGGNYNNNFSNSGGSGGGGGDEDFEKLLRQFEDMRPEEVVRSFVDQYSQYLVIIGVVIVLVCIISLVFYALGVMGKIGLVKGASKADAGAQTLTFGELWTDSLPYFWRMVGLSLLIGLPFFIILIILLVVFFTGISGFMAAGESTPGSAAGLLAALGIFVPAICCLSLASIIVQMIVEQAQNAIILEEKGVLAGLGRGWEVFKGNFLTVILMAIILGVLGGIVGFVIAIPLVLAVLPAVAGGVLMAAPDATANSAAWVSLIIAGLCCLAYFPVLLVVRGIQEAYIQSVWTLAYLRLTAPAAPAAALDTADAQ